MLNNIPDELKQYPQWVIWRNEITDSGKKTKIPYSRNGRKANPTDPRTFLTFADALKIKTDKYDGIGFVLHRNDPFAVIDLEILILNDLLVTVYI